MIEQTDSAGSGKAQTDALIEEFTQLPVRPGVGMQLLWMLDDENSSAAMLGALVETDPALSTRMIRLANSSYYGMRGRVASAQRAVIVIGLATVRALATSAIFDLFAEKGRAVPDDFWPHSLTTAAAASTLAGRVGLDVSDAFSTGLLLNLGTALVFRRARRRYEGVVQRVAEEGITLTQAEREEFGLSHAEVGAAALDLMSFPIDAVRAVRDHHSTPVLDTPMFTRVCAGASLLAHLVENSPQESDEVPMALLQEFGVGEDNLAAVVDEVRLHVEALTGFMTVG
ncbi:MAG: HDOD domain-containing protein [Acidimicrobiia bacterium]